jgi:hypothetical protein
MLMTKAICLVSAFLFVTLPAAVDAAGDGGFEPRGVAAGHHFPARPGWFVSAGRSHNGYGGGPAGGAADPATLSDEELAYMRLMRVEEMLARNVYLVFAGEWNLQVFAAISESEQRHMDAMKGLFARYREDDPVTPAMELAVDLYPEDPLAATGDTFGELHEYLVGLGTVNDESHTQVDPLSVGAFIEERDMLDIWNAVEATDNDDVVAVYQSLLCGSRNHLRAFVYQLEEIYGSEDYEAQVDIDDEVEVPAEVVYQDYWQAYIDAIIDSEVERCGRRVAETE